MSIPNGLESIDSGPNVGSLAVLSAAFASQLIVEGIFMSFTVYYPEMMIYFDATTTQISAVGSLAYGGWFLSAPFAATLVSRVGARWVVMGFGTLATLGMLISAFAQKLWHIMISFGLVVGISFGFIYAPSFTISSYFAPQKWRHFVAAFATVGGSLGGALFPQLFNLLSETEPWQVGFVVMAAIVAHLGICGMIFGVFQPVSDPEPEPKPDPELEFNCVAGSNNCETPRSAKVSTVSQDSKLMEVCKKCMTQLSTEEDDCSKNTKDVANLQSLLGKSKRNLCLKSLGDDYIIFKNPVFVAFLVSNFTWNAGYFAVLTLLPLLMTDAGMAGDLVALVFSVGAVAVMLGRVTTAGFTAIPKCSKLRYYNIVTLLAACCAVPIVFMDGTAWGLLAIVSIYWFFFGCQVAICPSTVIELVGLERLDYAVGVLLFVTGCGGIMGPIVTGVIKDAAQSFLFPFLAAAGFALIGFLVMVPSFLLST